MMTGDVVESVAHVASSLPHHPEQVLCYAYSCAVFGECAVLCVQGVRYFVAPPISPACVVCVFGCMNGVCVCIHVCIRVCIQTYTVDGRVCAWHEHLRVASVSQSAVSEFIRTSFDSKGGPLPLLANLAFLRQSRP